MKSLEADPVAAGPHLDPPAISIIIATRGRAELLKRCLDSLACQQAAQNLFEIIVVDNNDAPDPEVAKLCRPGTYGEQTVIYTHQPRRGGSRARNHGAALARGRWIGFLDDDATLPSAWVQQALDTAVASGAHIFGGPYYPVYATVKPAWFKDAYASGEYGSQPKWLAERLYLFAANLVVDRGLFSELGGFSTALGPGAGLPFGEETDLQHRAARRGERIWYEPGLRIEHFTFPAKMTLGWFVRSSWQKGCAKSRIFRDDSTRNRPVSLRLRLGWLRQAIGRALALATLLLRIPIRDRGQYPYPQNFVVERICPQLSNLALLAGLIGNTA